MRFLDEQAHASNRHSRCLQIELDPEFTPVKHSTWYNPYLSQSAKTLISQVGGGRVGRTPFAMAAAVELDWSCRSIDVPLPSLPQANPHNFPP